MGITILAALLLDTGRPAPDPVKARVEQWRAGKLRDDDIARLGRKAVRALRVHRGEARTDDLIAKIESAPRRVLYVEHAPRYEYRYLKDWLIRDASLAAQIFLLTADPEFPQEYSKTWEALTELPSTIEALLVYDLIILGDVPPGRVPAAALVSFVRDYGGGMIFLAPRNFAATPLESVLPVAATPSAKCGGWRVQTRAKAGATVLAEADRFPLFVTASMGRGRVFWSGTDETWRWRYLEGDGPRYGPFWREAMRWVAP